MYCVRYGGWVFTVDWLNATTIDLSPLHRLAVALSDPNTTPFISMVSLDVISCDLLPLVGTVVSSFPKTSCLTWWPTDPMNLVSASASAGWPAVGAVVQAEVGRDGAFWSDIVGQIDSTVFEPPLSAGEASPNPVILESTAPRFWSFFHFILRFWNHILIWRSVSCRAHAISMRRGRHR